MEQSEKSKKFISAVEKLLDSGEVKNKLEIVEALKWNNTALSNVLAGRRNIPADIYRRFANIYKVEDNKFLVNHDLNKFLGERIELGAAREAAIRVLVIWMKEVYAEVFKRPFVEVSLEFDRLAANELMQILDQLRQQQ
jgi:hypothetical protein